MRRATLGLIIAVLVAVAGVPVSAQTDEATQTPTPTPRPADACLAELVAIHVASAGTPAVPTVSVVDTALSVRVVDAVPWMNGTTTIQASAVNPDVQLLLQRTPGDQAYKRSLISLLSTDSGVGPFTPGYAEWIVEALQEPPLITIDGDIATLVIHHPNDLPVHSYTAEGRPRPAPPWLVDTVGRDLVFRINGDNLAADENPPRTIWRVATCFEGLSVIAVGDYAAPISPAATPTPTPVAGGTADCVMGCTAQALETAVPYPLPVAGDGPDRLLWILPPDPPSSEIFNWAIAPRVRPDAFTELRLRLFSGSRWPLAGAWLYVSQLFIIVVPLFILRGAPEKGALGTAVQRYRIASAAILILLAVGLYTANVRIFSRLDVQPIPPRPALELVTPVTSDPAPTGQDAPLLLVVNGRNFDTGSRVLVNGQVQQTDVGDGSTATAHVAPSALNPAGDNEVKIANSAGEESNTLVFRVAASLEIESSAPALATAPPASNPEMQPREQPGDAGAPWFVACQQALTASFHAPATRWFANWSPPSTDASVAAVIAFALGLFAVAARWLHLWATRETRTDQLATSATRDRWPGLILVAIALLGAPLVLLGSSDTPFAFLAGLVPLWAAGIAIYGLAQIILAVLPAAGRARLLSGRLPWWSVAASLLTVAVVVQWTRVVSGSAGSFWARQRLNDDPTRTRLTIFGDPCGAITALHDPATPLGGMASVLRGSLVTFPEVLLGSVAELVPFVVLVGMIGVLGAAGTAGTVVTPTAAETPAHPSEPPHWVRSSLIFLFAAFVVGYGGTLLGFRFPIQFALAWLLLVLTLRRNLLGPDSAESGAQAITERPHAHAFRIKGALAEVQAAAVRSATYKAWLPSTTDAKPNRVAQWRLASRPGNLSPRDLALALGPRESWWENGLLALKRGAVLAIVPVAFYFYVLFTTQMGQYVSERAQFGAIALVVGVASEVAFWLVAAFAFGCLYPLLRGDNGPTKGLVLAAIFLGSYIPALLFSSLEDAPWLVRAFQLALFLVALGVWIDLETLRAGNVYWRYLFPLYQIRSVQGVARYIAPILPIIVIVLRQLQSGEATAAIESILEVLGKEFPE